MIDNVLRVGRIGEEVVAVKGEGVEEIANKVKVLRSLNWILKILQDQTVKFSY